MQESQDLALHKRYLIRKLLDAIPGTAAIVSQKLAGLLQNPTTFTNQAEDKSLQQIVLLLSNPETKEVTREAIETKLEQLRTPLLPFDLSNQVVSYCQISELLKPMLLNKTWYRAALQQWRALLVNNFDVHPEVAQKLPHPNLVYHKIIYTLLREDTSTSSFKNFVEKYGINSFCFYSDVSDYQQFEEFFKHNVIPELNDAAILGNVSLVRYLIECLHRIPRAKTFWHAFESGSVPLIVYFILKYGFSLMEQDSYKWQYPPNVTEVATHWDVLLPTLSYENVALTGSVELIKKKRPKRENNGQVEGLEFIPNIMTVLNNAVRSRSLALVKYLFEDVNSPIYTELIQNKNLREGQVLTTAVQCSSVAIVQYLIEVRKLGPSLANFSTKVNIFKSGSVAMINFLKPQLQTATEHQTGDALFTESTIMSGSVRALKYACANNLANIHTSSRDNLTNAAKVGLLAVFKFLFVELATTDSQLVFALATKATFCSVMQYLVTDKNIPVDQQILADTEHCPLSSLRYLVEEKKILPDDTVIAKLGLTTHFNASYLKLVHRNPGRGSSSFWTKVLSSTCKKTVEGIEYQIHFDQKRQPQQWWSTLPLLRAFTGMYFAKHDYYRAQHVPHIGRLEITFAMSTILEIVRKARLLCYPDNFVEQEQIYFNALKDIQIELQRALKNNSDDPKAVAFYKYWDEFINKVILDCSELEESKATKSPASP